MHAFWEHLLLCAGQHLRGPIPSGYTVIGEVFQVNVLPSWGQCKLFKIILSLVIAFGCFMLQPVMFYYFLVANPN